VIRSDGIVPPPEVTKEEFMAANPNTPSIIAILIGMQQPPEPDAPPVGREFGGHIADFNARSDDPFGQSLTGLLLPAVQHDDTVPPNPIEPGVISDFVQDVITRLIGVNPGPPETNPGPPDTNPGPPNEPPGPLISTGVHLILGVHDFG